MKVTLRQTPYLGELYKKLYTKQGAFQDLYFLPDQQMIASHMKLSLAIQIRVENSAEILQTPLYTVSSNIRNVDRGY